MKSAILQHSNTVLTNYFTGKKMENSVSNGLGNKFQFKIENLNSTTVKKVCLCPAFFNTLSMSIVPETAEVVDTKDTKAYVLLGTSSVKFAYDSVAEMTNAGYDVDYVIDDYLNVASQIKVTAIDSARTIRGFLEYRKTNEMQLKSMTLATNNTDLYDGKLLIGHADPFNRVELEKVDLQDFYSVQQYQSGKINIDFASEGQVMLVNDTLMMILLVAPSTEVTVTLRF